MAYRKALPVCYEISKSVPLPSDLKLNEGGTQSPGRPWKYPWPKMAKNDSVLFKSDKEGFRSSLSHWKSLHPEQRWVIRRVEGGGIRVWRVE